MIDSLQLTAKHKVATPVNWQQGDDVIIAGSVSNDEAQGDLRRAGSAASPTSASSRSPAEPRPAGELACPPWRASGCCARGRFTPR